MTLPFPETPRMRLRPFTLADVPGVLAMSQEATSRRWLPSQVFETEAHALATVSALMEPVISGPMGR